MNSPEHRENVLTGNLENAGVGITMGSPFPDLQGGTTFALDFGTRDTRPSLSMPTHLTVDAGRVAADAITVRVGCSKACALRTRLIGWRPGDNRPVVFAGGRSSLTEAGSTTLTLNARTSVAADPRKLDGAELTLVTRARGTTRLTPVALR
jgi:hypothetical protein